MNDLSRPKADFTLPSRILILFSILLTTHLYPLLAQATEAKDCLDIPKDKQPVLVPVTGYLTAPWSFNFVPHIDGRKELLVTKKRGDVYSVLQENTGSGFLDEIKIHSVENVRTGHEGDRYKYSGLLGLAIDPNFQQNPYVYLAFTECGDGTGKPSPCAQLEDGFSHIAVQRIKYDPTTRLAKDPQIIFRSNIDSTSNILPGGRLAFLQDGTLLVSIGYRENNPNTYSDPLTAEPQRVDNQLGKIIRIDRAGGIPFDNPDPGSPIFSMGHRDPQGLYVDGKTIWSHEHGPHGGDELNIIVAGGNYGFPVVTQGVKYGDPVGKLVGAVNYHPQFIDPIFVWGAYSEQKGILERGFSIAPSGLVLYRGTNYPDWSGDLFLGTMKALESNKTKSSESGGSLLRLRIIGRTVEHCERILDFRASDPMQRVRDVQIGPDGFLYIAVHPEKDRTDGRGIIYRLEPRKPS